MIGIVFSQRDWTGVGDLDDCWVLSSLQCVNSSAPWLYLPSCPIFRRAAGDPDDGHNDGGNVAEIRKGVTTLYPEFGGKLDALRGSTLVDLRRVLNDGRPVSVALMAGKLPPRLNYGTKNVAHQCTLRQTSKGQLQFANPMVPHTGARWDDIDLGDVRDAILAFGNGKVFAVAFPTAEAMAPFYPAVSTIIDHEAERRAHALIAEAELRGFAEAKGKAAAAVGAITP